MAETNNSTWKKTFINDSSQPPIDAEFLNGLVGAVSKIESDLSVTNKYVPTTRTVNGKELTSNITLNAADVGAVPTGRTINGNALTGNISLSAADVGAAPASMFNFENKATNALTFGTFTFDGYPFAFQNAGSELVKIGPIVILNYKAKVVSAAAGDNSWLHMNTANGKPVVDIRETLLGKITKSQYLPASSFGTSWGTILSDDGTLRYHQNWTLTGDDIVSASFVYLTN